MLHGPLDNYIEMHRQRHGLSQAELAVLIEVEQRGTVSQFERGVRHPQLRNLIALELVLGESLQNLFAGEAQRVEEEVRVRARALLESLGDDPSPELIAKFELLSRLVRPDDSRIVPTWLEE
jgi:transcriptional regulator with XRE-family HTH domain